MSRPFKKDWVYRMAGGLAACLLLSLLSLSLSLSFLCHLRRSRDRRVDDFVRVLMDKRIRFRANELDTIEIRTLSVESSLLCRVFFLSKYIFAHSLYGYTYMQIDTDKRYKRQFLMPRNPLVISLAKMILSLILK